jgi:SH3-like domain-containing protein
MRKTVMLAAFAAALGCASLQDPQDARAYDCAHGPDFYRVINVESWDRLNIRSGPGTHNPVIASMPPTGVGVQCIGPCSGNWCRIAWQGVVGWVHMRYLGE